MVARKNFAIWNMVQETGVPTCQHEPLLHFDLMTWPGSCYPSPPTNATQNPRRALLDVRYENGLIMKV